MMENTGSYDNGCDTVNGYDENDSNSDINNDDNSQSNKCNGSKNDNTIITVVKKKTIITMNTIVNMIPITQKLHWL